MIDRLVSWWRDGRAVASARARAAEAEAELSRRQAEYLCAQYDHVTDAGRFQRSRPRPTPERGTEESEQLYGHYRSAAIADVRDLQRNDGMAAGLLLQFEDNVVGTGPKLRLNTADQNFNSTAARYFNRVWARECDARGTRHLSTLLALELSTVIREGDLLCWYDRAGIIPETRGRLWYWEADQLVEVDDWGRTAEQVAGRLAVDASELVQTQGVICDQWGRVVGYAVSSLRNSPVQPLSACTILPATDATLLSAPWRISGLRGVSKLAPITQDLQDLRRYRFAVIQRQLIQAHLALMIKRKDAASLGVARVTTSDLGSRGPAVTDTPPSAETAAGRRYRNFERMPGVKVEYMEPEETAEALTMSPDQAQFAPLTESVGIAAGYGVGVTRLHSQGKADASYSASRAEGNLDERTWQRWQKWLERYSLDWKARRVLGQAIDEGRLRAVEDWTSYSWAGWPKAMSLNPQQEAAAEQTRLATGTETYSDLLGPDWRERFDELAAELDYARERGIPLAVLAKAVAAAASAPPKPEEDDGKDA